MQRFFEENFRKNLSLKFIHINNVTYLSITQKQKKTEVDFIKLKLRKTKVPTNGG
jgi:predicted transcriptional regulator